MNFTHTTIERWHSAPYRIERIDGGRYWVQLWERWSRSWVFVDIVNKPGGYATLPEAIAACEQHAEKGAGGC